MHTSCCTLKDSALRLSSTCGPGAWRLGLSLETLTKLDRGSPKYAQRIIDYGENVGLFEKPEDIMKVEGIGAKTFEANKDRIVVK